MHQLLKYGRLLCIFLTLTQLTLASPGFYIPCYGPSASFFSCSLPNCGKIGGNAKWLQNPHDRTQCQINDCSAAAYAITDDYCLSCPPTGTTSEKTYANFSGIKCIAASATCSAKRTVRWTNADCVLCSSPQLKYASVDRKTCIDFKIQISMHSILTISALIIMFVLL